jgi:hypothetical protein
MVDPLTPQREQERGWPLQRLRELPRSGVSLACIARAIPTTFYQCLAKSDLQIEFALPAPVVIRQGRNQREPATEQRHRLG